jgi:tetratricopeptide (TPR) repeat protein
MDLIFKSQDALLIIIVPLVLVTANEVRKNWASLWDENLTTEDRRLLLRASLFLLEPLVVLFHELGHAAATLAFGGKIAEFHFAVLSGYVVPTGMFTYLQIFLIYLAGNAVSILIGYACLAAALFFRSPPVVATLVYLGLWSIGSAAVLYALMSVLGIYGDWSAMYAFLLAPAGSSAHTAAVLLAVCHAVVVASLVYLLIGKRPRLWFASRTRLDWAQRYRTLRVELQADPSLDHFLRMAWLFYEASLLDLARKMLDTCMIIDGEAPEPWMLYGFILIKQTKFDQAEMYFLKVVQSERATAILRARAYMAIANSRLVRADANRSNPKKAQEEALEAYAAASKLVPNLGDPKYLRAVMLNELERYCEAAQELQSLSGLNWIDDTLLQDVPKQLEIAIKAQTTKR